VRSVYRPFGVPGRGGVQNYIAEKQRDCVRRRRRRASGFLGQFVVGFFRRRESLTVYKGVGRVYITLAPRQRVRLSTCKRSRVSSNNFIVSGKTFFGSVNR